MAEHLLILDRPQDWALGLPGVSVITPQAYLTEVKYSRLRHARVLNLSHDYGYLSSGYYCSLLAEARRHRVIPSVKTLQDLSRRAIYRLGLDDLAPAVQKALGGMAVDEFALEIYFGSCGAESLRDIARQLFTRFPVPALEARFRRQGGMWLVQSLRPLDIEALDEGQAERMAEALAAYLARRWRQPRPRRQAAYDLAILHDPDEALPPSDETALKRFIRAGRACGLDVELIRRKDLARLAEYDALFIRETTRIDHHTYRFARKAQTEGLVVIDDPDSILRCTNKVYLAELLRTHGIATPQTLILNRETLRANLEVLGFPVVLKIPDGSFSRGVVKADDRDAMLRLARPMLRESDLILAQAFVYTPYDWRVGILNHEPLYVCQYHMSKRHWQIIDHGRGGREGGFTTLPVEAAPPAVVDTALKAARLIGDGLYGVDLKAVDGQVLVIEVNDNPSIEAGVEDAVLKQGLYERIMAEFRRRLDVSRAESR